MTPPDRTGIIYLAVSRDTRKAYIGKSTRTFCKRTSEHKYDSKRSQQRQVFHRAVSEFGYDSFDFAVLETCNTGDLKEREIYWIDYFGSRDPEGYNVSLGPGSLGVKRTPEHVAKLRGLFTGKPKSEAHKAKLRVPKSAAAIASSIESRKRPEYKKLISESLLKAWQTRSRAAQSERQ